MKTNFRKVVSVVCAIAMLLSLCTVSFINTASAAVLGTTEGSYKDVVKYDFDNATGIGHVRFVDEFKYQDGSVYVNNGANGGALYFAANPTDGAAFTTDKTAATCDLLKLEAGTKYKITLKYKYLAGATDTGFSLFYAKNPDGDINSNGEFAGSQSQTVDSNVTKDNPLTADTAWKDYTFEFTPTSSDHCIGIKPVQPNPDKYKGETNDNGRYTAFLIDDVVIQKWNEATTIVTNMTAHTDSKYSGYGSSTGSNGAVKSITANEDCSVTFSVSHINAPSDTEDWFLNRTVLTSDGDVVYLEKGCKYNITVEYKIDSTTGSAYVGFSYQNGGGYSNLQVKSMGYNKHDAGYVSTDWEEFTMNINPDDLSVAEGVTKIALRLTMCGNPATITVKSVTINRADPGYMFVDFNDNGNLTTEIVKIGDATRKGTNTYNTETLGEAFIGWYADPQFTTPVTTYSTDYTTLYAKYPSTIIDFNNVTEFENLYAKYDGVSATVNDGKLTYVGSTAGIMVLAYDADLDQTDTANAFYQFVPGNKYKLTFVTESISTNGTMRFYDASNGGQEGGRGSQRMTWYVSASSSAATYSIDFTFPANATHKGISLSFLSGTPTVVFDKIIVTAITGNEEYFANVTFNDNGKVTFVHANEGDVVVAPEAHGKDGYIFAGWYRSDYDPSTASGIEKSKYDENAYGPISVIAAPAKDSPVTYNALYLDKNGVTVDFSDDWYSTNIVAGGNTNASNGFSIVTSDDGSKYAHFERDDNNSFKMSLVSNGVKTYVYDGVTYDITIDYEVVKVGTTAGAKVGVLRNKKNGFYPFALSGTGGASNIVTHTTTCEKTTGNGQKTVSNMYIAENFSKSNAINYGGTSNISNELSLHCEGGTINVYKVVVKPVSYTPVLEKYISNVENGTVQLQLNADGTGTVTAKPADGYTLAASGVKLVRDFRTYTKTEEKEGETTYVTVAVDSKAQEYSLALATTDGSEFTFDLSKLSAEMLRTLTVKVDFVSKTKADNAAFIGASIRNQSAAVTAGLRFRARISDATVAAAQKIEFVAVPENELTDCNGLVKDYTGTMLVTGVAYEKDGKNIVYDASIDGFTDYQVCITGLNESAQALKIAVAVKITGADDNVTWIQINNNQSFNGLK